MSRPPDPVRRVHRRSSSLVQVAAAPTDMPNSGLSESQRSTSYLATAAKRIVSFAGPGTPILWMALFKVVLDVSYYIVRSGSQYYALPRPVPDPVKIVESFGLLAIVVFAVSKDWHRVSTLFIWMMLVLSFVPMLTIYAIGPEDRLFMYATTAFWAAVGYASRSLGDLRMPYLAPKVARRLVLGLYPGLCLVAVVVLVVYLGGDLVKNVLTTKVNLSNFYAIRAVFVAAGLPLHGYYFYWLAQVFNPVFFVIALIKRRWVVAGLIFIWQLVIAEVVGQRGFVFDVAFAGALAWLLTRREPSRAISVGIVALMVAGVAAFYFLGQPLWYYFFTGRFLLDAAQLSFNYYHFFSEHGSIPFAYLIKFYLYLPYPWYYPYVDDPAYVVSDATLHMHLAAVGGVVADAYMNFGFAGLAIWAVGFTLLAKLIDAAALDLDRRVAVAALAVPAIALTNTYTVRAVVAGGLGWSLILLFVLARSRLLAAASSQAEVTESQV